MRAIARLLGGSGGMLPDPPSRRVFLNETLHVTDMSIICAMCAPETISEGIKLEFYTL